MLFFTSAYRNIIRVKKHTSLCWFYTIICVSGQCWVYEKLWVLSKSSCIKQRFDLFLLITVVKDKRMQENLTLVVSWNVGENQVVQWAGVDCKPLGSPTETVRSSINNSSRILWPFSFLMFLIVFYSHSIISKCSVIFTSKCAEKKLQIWVCWEKSWASA